MSADKPYRLAVIGAEPAGFAAAAVAALSGARVVVLPAGWEDTLPSYASRPAIPPDIWRRLALHRSGLVERSAPACVSLRADGKSTYSYKSLTDTRDALERASAEDAAALPDFLAEMARVRQVAGVMANGADPEALADPAVAAAARVLVRPYREAVARYFEASETQSHLAARTLYQNAAAPGAYGSAGAFAEALDPDAWPARDEDGFSAADALRKVAQDAGAEISEARIARIEMARDGLRIHLADGETLRAKSILAASERSAHVAGVAAAGRSRAGRDPGTTEAFVRLRLAQPASAPDIDMDDGSLFCVCDSIGEVQRAFDQAKDGAWPDKPPMFFELSPDRKEIYARAPIAPGRFFVDGKPRGWSEQDRQAFATRVVRRLSERLEGIDRTLRRTEVRVMEGPLDEDGAPLPVVTSPDVHVAGGAHGDVRAAVRLVDRLLGSGAGEA